MQCHCRYFPDETKQCKDLWSNCRKSKLLCLIVPREKCAHSCGFCSVLTECTCTAGNTRRPPPPLIATPPLDNDSFYAYAVRFCYSFCSPVTGKAFVVLQRPSLCTDQLRSYQSCWHSVFLLQVLQPARKRGKLLPNFFPK